MKFIRRCVRQMHELRLHKHLKTKEVEMLVSATINIISVDEKVGNFCLENLGEEFWLHFQCSLVAEGWVSTTCARSRITIPIVLRHTAAHGEGAALGWMVELPELEA